MRAIKVVHSVLLKKKTQIFTFKVITRWNIGVYISQLITVMNYNQVM